jgi:hypothetical protein
MKAQENDDSHGDFATSYFIVSVMPALHPNRRDRPMKNQ